MEGRAPDMEKFFEKGIREGMKQWIFDSHAHYDDSRFDEDRHELLASLPAQGVGYVMNVACDLASCSQALQLANQYEFVYAAAGIHPQAAGETQTVPDYRERLRKYLKQPKVRALGEIGLDYHYEDFPRELQRKVFAQQLELAVELDVPVIVHDRDAHQDTLELLKKYRPKGIVHCYTGSAPMVKDILELGLYIGFTGVVTFKNARKVLEAAASVPLDRLLIETDCPYMAPEPVRGRRCDSSLLQYTAARLAQLKGVSPEELVKTTCENACRVYRIENRLPV